MKCMTVINDLGGVLTSNSPQEVTLELRCPSQTGCHLLKKRERRNSLEIKKMGEIFDNQLAATVFVCTPSTTTDVINTF